MKVMFYYHGMEKMVFLNSLMAVFVDSVNTVSLNVFVTLVSAMTNKTALEVSDNFCTNLASMASKTVLAEMVTLTFQKVFEIYDVLVH